MKKYHKRSDSDNSDEMEEPHSPCLLGREHEVTDLTRWSVAQEESSSSSEEENGPNTIELFGNKKDDSHVVDEI